MEYRAERNREFQPNSVFLWSSEQMMVSFERLTPFLILNYQTYFSFKFCCISYSFKDLNGEDALHI